MEGCTEVTGLHMLGGGGFLKGRLGFRVNLRVKS